VGNVIGSNILNITAILGASALLAPIAIPTHLLTRELPALLVLSLLLLPLMRTDWRVQRWEGAVLVAAYLAAGFALL
jgi:cation:H+ antiporter